MFDEKPTGELSSRLAVDTLQMTNSIATMFRFAVDSPLRIMSIAVYMFLSEWRLALVVLGFIPVCTVTAKIYCDWIHVNAMDVQVFLVCESVTPSCI